MTTLVTTTGANGSDFNTWYSGIPASTLVSSDLQYVFLAAPGDYTNLNDMNNAKTSDFGATDVGYGTARIVVIADPSAGSYYVPNSGAALKYDSTKGVRFRTSSFNQTWQRKQTGMEWNGIQFDGSSGSSSGHTITGRDVNCVFRVVSGVANWFGYTGHETRNCLFMSDVSGIYAYYPNAASIKHRGTGFVHALDQYAVFSNGGFLNVDYRDCYAINGLAGTQTKDPWGPSGTNSFLSTCRANATNFSSAGICPTAGGGSATVITNSAFISAASQTSGTYDLRLATGSALSGVGITDSVIPKDLFGVTRPGTPAIGPVEIVATAAALAGVGGAQAGGSGNLAGPAALAGVGGAVPGGSGSLKTQAGLAGQGGAAPGGLGTLGYPPGTLVIGAPLGIKNNAGALQSNISGFTLHVYQIGTGNKVGTKTGLSTTQAGIIVVTDNSLFTVGVTYAVLLTDGTLWRGGTVTAL